MRDIAEQAQVGTDFCAISPARIAISKSGVRLLAAPNPTKPVIVQRVNYVAPETIRHGTQDESSLLYSLGCTLFELVAGTAPFASENPKATLKAHLTAVPPSLEHAAPGTPPRLLAVVNALLQRDPTRRPNSLAEVAQALVNIDSDAPPIASVPTRTSTAASRRPTSRSRLAARRRREEDDDGKRPTRKKKSYGFTIAGALIGLVIALFLVPWEIARQDRQTLTKRDANRSKLEVERSERKEALRAEIGAAQAEVDRLIQTRGSDAQAIGYHLAELVHARGAERLGELYVDLAMTGGAKKGGEVDPAYEELRAKISELLAENRHGDALKQLADAGRTFPGRTADIERQILEVSEQLTKQWNRDKNAIEAMLRRERFNQALSLIAQVHVYGDAPIRRELETYEDQARRLKAEAQAEVEAEIMRAKRRRSDKEDDEEDEDEEDDDEEEDEEDEEDDWGDDDDEEEDEEEEDEEDDWGDDDDEEEDDDDWGDDDEEEDEDDEEDEEDDWGDDDDEDEEDEDEEDEEDEEEEDEEDDWGDDDDEEEDEEDDWGDDDDEDDEDEEDDWGDDDEEDEEDDWGDDDDEEEDEDDDDWDDDEEDDDEEEDEEDDDEDEDDDW